MNVFFCGSHSTGKTSLINSLRLEWDNCEIISEAGRTVLINMGIDREELKQSEKRKEYQKNLLDYQWKQHEEVGNKSKPGTKFLFDRCIVDNLGYCLTYCGRTFYETLRDNEQTKKAVEMYQRSESIIFLIEPQQECIKDDNVRMVTTLDEAKLLSDNMKSVMDELGLEYHCITVLDMKERIQFVTNKIDKMKAYELYSKTYSSEEELMESISKNIDLVRNPLPQKVHLEIGEVAILAVTIGYAKLTVSYSANMTNRMFDIFTPERFLFCQFHFRAEPEQVSKIMSSGLTINEQKYVFAGFTSSQLRTKTCIMFRGTTEELEKIQDEVADFSSISSIAKRTARIGLLYSSCIPVLKNYLTRDMISNIEDVERNNHIFTDGCGVISKNLASKISQELRLGYVPSVFQVRIMGCKGVLVVADFKAKDSIQIKIRDSMTKFTWKHDSCVLGIVNYSKSQRFAVLNNQAIMLFSGLGVRDEAFIEAQRSYFEKLNSLATNIKYAINFCSLHGRKELRQDLTNLNTNNTVILQRLRQKEIQRNFEEILETGSCKQKLRLPISKARNLYGVADITGRLKENQCYIRVSTAPDKFQTIVGKVAVTKNPCYFIGDVRVLDAVDLNLCLEDCIVFSTQGQVPTPHKMAGSDLDGDVYLVCWDENFIPARTENPFAYPPGKVKEQQNITRTDYINYFVHFDRTVLGKVNSKYQFFANRSPDGVESKYCIDLGTKIFSAAVDAAKSGERVKIPGYILTAATNLESKCEEDHVWVKMNRNNTNRVTLWKKELVTSKSETLTQEILLNILQNKIDGVSEYELYALAKTWCRANQCEVRDYISYIDFGSFDANQKYEAIKDGVPEKVVRNALNKSSIISTESLELFNLDHSDSHWKLFYKADRYSSNFHVLTNALSRFRDVLFSFNMAQFTSVIFRISGQYEKGSEMEAKSIIGYIFHHQHQKKYSLPLNGKIHFDNSMIQIYRNTKSNTFVKLSSDEDSERIVMSLDLGSFGEKLPQLDRINKQWFQTLEVFVAPIQSRNSDKHIYDTYNFSNSNPEINLAREQVSVKLTEFQEQVTQIIQSLSTKFNKEAWSICFKDCLRLGLQNEMSRLLDLLTRNKMANLKRMSLSANMFIDVVTNAIDTKLSEIDMLIQLAKIDGIHATDSLFRSISRSIANSMSDLELQRVGVKVACRCLNQTQIHLVTTERMQRVRNNEVLILRNQNGWHKIKVTVCTDSNSNAYQCSVDNDPLLHSILEEYEWDIYVPRGCRLITNVADSLHKICAEQKNISKLLKGCYDFSSSTIMPPTKVIDGAVIHALNTALSLVHTPPGCNKTKAVLDIVKAWDSGSNSCPILILAESDFAADNIVATLLDNDIGVTRLGGHCRKSISHVCFHKLGEKKMKPVVCSTFSGIEHFIHREWGKIIVEESSQFTYQQSLIPLSLEANRIVLFGDYIQSFHLKERSMFEMLYSSNEVPKTLLNEVKLAPEILNYPNEHMYGNLLKSLEPSSTGVKMIHNDGPQDKQENEYYNTNEVEIAKTLIEYLLNNGFNAKEIGVISWYPKQVELLKNAFEGRAEIEVGPLEQFAGRQKSVVVISTVRTMGSEDIDQESKRMNVAITRASTALFVIGNEDFLSGDIWSEWMDWCKKNSLVSDIAQLSIQRTKFKNTRGRGRGVAHTPPHIDGSSTRGRGSSLVSSSSGRGRGTRGRSGNGRGRSGNGRGRAQNR